MALIAQNRYTLRRVQKTGFQYGIVPETLVLPADGAGNVTSFVGAQASIRITYDGVEVMPNYNAAGLAKYGLQYFDPDNIVSPFTAVGCTAEWENKKIRIISMSADAGYIDIPISVGSMLNTTVRLTLAKSKAGTAGASGVGINTVDVEYAKNTSASVAPTSGWGTSAPAISGSEQLWTRTKTTFSTLAVSYSTPANITPKSGRSVLGIVEEYAMNTSKATEPTTGWSTIPPTWSYGYYIWTRSKITYSTGTITEYTTPVCSSEWEAVNQIQLGTRNLVRNSGNFVKTDFWICSNPPALLNAGFLKINTGGYTTSTNISITQNAGFTLKKNTDYTLKFTYRSNYAGSVYVYSGDWASAYSMALSNTSSQNTEITFNFKTGANTACNELMFQVPGGKLFEVGYILLVEGNKAGGWAPAPEDISSQIDYINTDLGNLLADNVLSRAEKPAERIRWEAEYLDYKNLKEQSSAIGGTSIVTDYINSFKALSMYLNAGVIWVEPNIPSWLGTYMNYDTNIVAASYRSAWTTYFNYKSELLRFYESGVIVGGDNLLNNSERIIIGESQQSSNSQYRSIYDKLNRNTWYVFSVEEITMLAGDSHYATILIYNFANNVVLASNNFTVGLNETQEFAFKTDNIRDYSVLLYAGLAGATQYKKAQYEKVTLQEGNRRTAWRPSLGDQLKKSNYQNLLKNGNFLGGKVPWTAHEGGTFDTSTNDKMVPSGALGLAKRSTLSNGGGIHYPTSELKLVQGDYYSVSFLLRIDKNSYHQTDNQYITFGHLGDETAMRYITVYGVWQLHTFTFQHVATPNLFVFSMGYPCDMYITNIMLVAGKEPAPFSNNYLEAALEMDTDVNGGLILTSLIAARDTNMQVKTYMNGLATNEIAFAAGVSNFGASNETREFQVTKDGKFRVNNTKAGRSVIIEPESMPTYSELINSATYETLSGTGQYSSNTKTMGEAFTESTSAQFTLTQTSNVQFMLRGTLRALKAGVNAQVNVNNVFNDAAWWWEQSHWNGSIEFGSGRSVTAKYRALPAGGWNTISGLTNGADLQVTLSNLPAGSYEVVLTVTQSTPTNNAGAATTFTKAGYGIEYVNANSRRYTRWAPGYVGTTWLATKSGTTVSETQESTMPYVVYELTQEYELSISDIRVESKTKRVAMYADGFAAVSSAIEYFIVRYGASQFVDTRGVHRMSSTNGLNGIEITDGGVKSFGSVKLPGVAGAGTVDYVGNRSNQVGWAASNEAITRNYGHYTVPHLAGSDAINVFVTAKQEGVIGTVISVGTANFVVSLKNIEDQYVDCGFSWMIVV